MNINSLFARPSKSVYHLLINICLVLILSGCGSTDLPPDINPALFKSSLQVVDCLLPGQVRQIGRQLTTLSARRPIRTTAGDCEVRGGEYVAYDRADYQSALAVWLEVAELGDPEAQVKVGEIYEQGLGVRPDYEEAAIWYQRAAEQGNSSAQYSLGTMYEQGLGVEADMITALNWYRLAAGIPEGNELYQSAVQKEVETRRESLEQELQQKSYEIDTLNRRIQELNELINEQADNTDELEQEIAALTNIATERREEINVTESQINDLPRFRMPDQQNSTITGALTPASINSEDLDFGKYYALVIGNQNYSNIDNLDTPHQDALEVASILEQKYGFSVVTLLDVQDDEIMNAINDLSQTLNEEDNLVIFYAGHGNRVSVDNRENGYWLPINADPAPRDTYWVSNEFITGHMSIIKAKSVLIVADSCYAGLLSSAPNFANLGDSELSLDLIELLLPIKSRLLLSSGGDFPVLDNAGDGHSVFAKAFIKALEENNGIMDATKLFLSIEDQVKEGASALGVEQEPQLQALKSAGHENGEFFFVVNN